MMQAENYPLFELIKGEGHPIIFLHGSPLDHRVMVAAFEPIFAKQEGWQRVYLDLPGMGQTKGADWIQGNDDIVEIVLSYIDRKFPNQSVSLVGFSFGGYISRGLSYRLQERCSGLMLMAAAVHGEPSKRDLPETGVIVANPELMATLEPALQDLFSRTATVQTPEVIQRSLDEAVPAVRIADQSFLARIRPNYRLTYEEALMQYRFEKPALIVAGRQDVVTGYADGLKIEKLFPRGTFAVLDRAGHGVQMDEPTLFNALVENWLMRLKESLSLPAPIA